MSGYDFTAKDLVALVDAIRQSNVHLTPDQRERQAETFLLYNPHLAPQLNEAVRAYAEQHNIAYHPVPQPGTPEWHRFQQTLDGE